MPLRRPWVDVNPAIVPDLRQRLPDAIDATIDAIRVEVPSYADFGAGPIAVTVRRGVEFALQRWLALLGSADDALDPAVGALYARIGAGEWRAGRSMEALLAAYRTGARVVWENMSAAAVAAGAAPQDLIALAEAIFVYIDELSAASASGYADARTADAGRLQSARLRLARVLLDGNVDASDVRTLAIDAAWVVPERLVVGRAWVADGVAWPRLEVAGDVLLADRGESRVVLAPAARARRRDLESRGVRVVFGLPGPPEHAAESLRIADRLTGWLEATDPTFAGDAPNTDDVGGIWRAEDYQLELMAAADPAVVAWCAQRWLTPVLDQPEGKRTALLDTLWAWLATGGDRAVTADMLHVHPQTISYRLGRLRELLGDALTQPQARAILLVVLSGVPEVGGGRYGGAQIPPVV